MAADPAIAAPVPTTISSPPTSSPANRSAWRLALTSAAALWVAIAVVLVAAGRPYTALTYAAPLLLAAAALALVAARLPVRLPAVVYPVVVLVVATLLNAPVLDLLF